MRLRCCSLAMTLTLGAHKTGNLYHYFSSGHGSTFALKNVTRSNFESALADLRGLICGADFVSVDLEMTGISSAPWRESFEFDRPDVRYLKVKDSAEKFAVIQFGVCPFRWDQSKQGFVANPHNFYIFPRQDLLVDGLSNEFFCQTSSMKFLTKYQFDFNTCIHEGVSYISKDQEVKAFRSLNLAHEDELSETCCDLNGFEDIPLVKMADVLFTERTKDKISEWHAGLFQERSAITKFPGSSNDLKQQFQTCVYKMRPALMLSGFTSHQMKLIQLVTKQHFPDLSYVRENGKDSCLQHLLVHSNSKDDKTKLLKEVKDELHKEAEMKVKAAVGFRQVIDLLSSEQKLIVGHNCCLDVAHVYCKFIGHLPSTTEEFASSVHRHFPSIIDTKILLNADHGLRRLMKKNSTSLSKAFSLLCPHLASSFGGLSVGFRPCVKVEVQVDGMSSCNWNSGAKHEAGYDAFMTGCIFAQACSHLGIDFKMHSSSSNLASNEKLKNHANLLYLSWNSGEIIDLRTSSWSGQASNNIKKRYSKVFFSNIILIWGFPSQLATQEIKECICRAFGPTSVTSIFNIDATAVFVLFSQPGLVSEFMRLRDGFGTGMGPVSGFDPLLVLFEGGDTRVASYEMYKEICGSPVSEMLFADQAEAVGVKWKGDEYSEEHGSSVNGDGAMEDVPDGPAGFISQLAGL